MKSCKTGCCKILYKEYKAKKTPHRRMRCKKGGAFIYDPHGNKILLVQSRNSRWGSPKGTQEPNESIRQCAIREVKEETGLDITKLHLDNFIFINKKVFYYIIQMSECDVKIENFEENDATGITWIKLECLRQAIIDGDIELNYHTRSLFYRLFRITFEKNEWQVVKRKKTKLIQYKR